MKEVIAVIQMNKIEATKNALEVIGIPSFTAYKAYGRGKQQGLHIAYSSFSARAKRSKGEVFAEACSFSGCRG